MSKLPKDFLWGASSSAYQLEGGWNADGKGMSVQDLQTAKENVCDFKTASDHYNHWKEDVALMAEMGFKSYRFSVAWTRFFPDGKGKVNQKGIQFYSDLIDELKKYNIEPILTMFHFDPPLKLIEEGGWSNRKMIDYFVEFAKVLFDNFANRVKYWLTINEQNIMIMVGHIIGTTKIVKGIDPFVDLYQQNHHMMVAQAKVIELYQKNYSKITKGIIGPAPSISYVYPKDSNPINIEASYKANSLRNWLYIDCLTKGGYNKVAWNWMEEMGYTPIVEKEDLELFSRTKADYIGFNYYTTMSVEHNLEKEVDLEKSDQQKSFDVPNAYKVFDNKFLNKTEFGWEIDPHGFLHTCRALNDRYNLPIMITENGMGAYDKLVDGKVHDEYRINYLRDHIKYLPQIISEGIKFIGYNPWSAIDLVSTHEGIKKRYGLIYVDKDDNENGTFKRYRKDSFYWYKKVIESNGEDLK